MIHVIAWIGNVYGKLRRNLWQTEPKTDEVEGTPYPGTPSVGKFPYEACVVSA